MDDNSTSRLTTNRRKFVKATGAVALATGGLGAAQPVGATSHGGHHVENKDSDKWEEYMQVSYGTYDTTTTEVSVGVGEFTWSSVDGSSYWHKVIEPELCATTWREGQRYNDLAKMYLEMTYPEQYTVNAEDRPKSRGAYEVPNSDTNWNEEDEEAVETVMSELIPLMVRNPAFDASMFVLNMGAAVTELLDSTDKVSHTWDILNLAGDYQNSAGAWFKATAEMLKDECMDYTITGNVSRYAVEGAYGLSIGGSVCTPSYAPYEAVRYSVSASDYEGDAKFVTISPKEFQRGVNMTIPAEAQRPLKAGTPIVVVADE